MKNTNMVYRHSMNYGEPNTFPHILLPDLRVNGSCSDITKGEGFSFSDYIKRHK